MPDAGNISRELMLDLGDGRRILNPILVKCFDKPPSPPHKTTPQLLDRWTKLSALKDVEHEVIVLWGFAETHVFGFEREWDGFAVNDENVGVYPESSRGHAGTTYFLPKGVVSETLAKLIQPVFDVVDYLKSKGLNVSTLAGPPPGNDNDYIKRQFIAFTPSSPLTRLRIYKILIDLYRTHAAANCYSFFESPSTLVDEFGFLRREYWGDGVHANGLYGREIMLSLERVLFQASSN